MWFADRRLHIGLLQDRVVLQPAGGRTEPAQLLPVLPADKPATAAWQPAVTRLAQWLQEHNPAHKVPVKARLNLSSHFVRWQLLDWAEALQQPQELQAYAQLQTRATFGPGAQGWQVAHADPQPGQALPVCAVDQALTDALHALQTTHGLQLTVLAPYFAVAFDHWRSRLPTQACWFGAVEPGGLTLGLIQGSAWRGLRVQRLPDAEPSGWPAQLPSLRAQMALAADQPKAVDWPVFLAGCTPAPSGADTRADFTWLAPRGDQRSPLDRLAWGV